MQFRYPLAVLAGVLALLSSGIAAGSDDITGLWVTEGERSIVDVALEGDRYAAAIIAIKDPLYLETEETPFTGQPRTDRHNKDAALRDRPLLGLRFLEGFVANGRKWVDGSVYDPESGNTYSGTITLDGADTLKLRGYLGIPMLGRTSLWRRVTRCDTTTAALLAASKVSHAICRAD